MSTATVDTPKPSKTSNASTAPARLHLHQSTEAAEQAVTQLMQAGTSAVRTFVPPAMLRPTETVGLLFDVAEQVLGASRRFALELARVV